MKSQPRISSPRIILPLLALVVTGTMVFPTLAAKADEPPTIDVSRYEPLNPGTVLTFRGKGVEDQDWWHEERAEIWGPVDFHGVQAKRRAWIESGAIEPYEIEYSNTDETNTCSYGTRSDEGDTLYVPPVCFPRQMAIGQTYSADTIQVLPNGTQIPSSFVVSLVGQESVTVPAGIFPDSLHLQGAWNTGLPNETYLAKDLGWIKGTSNPGNPDGWNSELVAFYTNYGECLMNWAENTYPDMFSPKSQVTQYSSPYHYRYYSDTTFYLGVSDADNHVYYQDANGVLNDVGPLSEWLPQSDCRPAPTACLFAWAENNYPYLFSPPTEATVLSFDYIYRYYPETGYYLGVSSADNHVYYLGLDGVMSDAGPFGYWRSLANCPP